MKKTKGHWPKGKRRNVDLGDWQRMRLRLAQYLEQNWEPGVCTAEQLSREIGASARTVRRWLSGEDRPHTDWQAAIKKWLKERAA